MAVSLVGRVRVRVRVEAVGVEVDQGVEDLIKRRDRDRLLCLVSADSYYRLMKEKEEREGRSERELTESSFVLDYQSVK